MPEEERAVGEALLVGSCTRGLPSAGVVAGAGDTAVEAPLGVKDLGM